MHRVILECLPQCINLSWVSMWGGKITQPFWLKEPTSNFSLKCSIIMVKAWLYFPPAFNETHDLCSVMQTAYSCLCYKNTNQSKKAKKMSGVTIYLGMNVRGGNLICARMSGVVIWLVHKCPALSKLTCELMSVWTNIRTPKQNTEKSAFVFNIYCGVTVLFKIKDAWICIVISIHIPYLLMLCSSLHPKTREEIILSASLHT